MSQLLGRLWDRAQGKLDVLRICDRVFEKLADKNTKLLGISNLDVAILMVYNKINKKIPIPYKDPPSTKVIAEKMECYRAEKMYGIPREDFQKLIMEWVSKDLRFIFAIKAAVSILVTPLVTEKVKDVVEDMPRTKHAVEKVPKPLFFTIISLGVMVLQEVHPLKR